MPPSSQIFIISSNFRDHRWDTERGVFPWPSCYFFRKKWSNYKISYYYFRHKSTKSLSFKKVSNEQSDIHITIKYVCILVQIIVPSQKIDVRLNKSLKLKFILMVFC